LLIDMTSTPKLQPSKATNQPLSIEATSARRPRRCAWQIIAIRLAVNGVREGTKLLIRIFNNSKLKATARMVESHVFPAPIERFSGTQQRMNSCSSRS
jgi:hypothetical protein